jgi:hypothetical protein
VVDFTQKVQVLAGLLVAGFAGALNFIGLRSEEVSAVLRNEAHYPTLVLALIVAGILTAIASIFVNPQWMVREWAWLATACWLVVPVAVTVALISIPGTTATWEYHLAVGVAGAAGLLTIFFLIIGYLKIPWRKKPLGSARESGVSAQGLLVFVAIALTATSVYAALRLETRSQLASTAAQLSATVDETSGTASLDVSIQASKMASADRVNVSITGLERDARVGKLCQNVRAIGTLRCFLAPCYVTHFRRPVSPGCDSLSSGIYQPNADGSVSQKLVIPFSDIRYQRLELLGEVCTVEETGMPCVYQQRNVTRVDIEIPEYSASPSS